MAQERGGVFLVTDPPPSLEFGIDCMSYETKADFRGICMISPGLHFIYWSTGMGARQGTFLIYEKNQIIVKSWDPVIEDLLPTHSLSDWSLGNLLNAIQRGELDANLGPYPIETYSSWQNLSNYVSLPTLKLVGLSPHTPVFPGDYDELPHEKKLQQNLQSIQPYFPNAARMAQYCDLKTLEKSCLQSLQLENHNLLSQFHLDRSDFLTYLLSVYYQNWENLLGELQISFVLFMLIYSHPALEHWKSLVHLICSSDRILTQNPQFTCGFLRTFYEQLHYSPDDFFETEISYDNFLRPTLSSLFETLEGNSEIPLDQHVREHRNRLVTFTQKKFNLFQDESLSNVGGNKFTLVDEDMPVIVTQQEIQHLEQFSNELSSSNQTIDNLVNTSVKSTSTTATKTDLQEGLFSWRYPLIYDEMKRFNKEIENNERHGGEDLVMTSMRILDEMEDTKESKQLLDEAMKFLENEVSLWNSNHHQVEEF